MDTAELKNTKLIKLRPMISDASAMEMVLATVGEITLKSGRKTQQGIYLGKYKPKGRDGKSLGKTFSVFAAPEDLPEPMVYIDTARHVAKMKGWNGFNGASYATDKKLYAALKDGSYKGGWIIPPRELLTGTRPDDEAGPRNKQIIQPDNLFDRQNEGAFNLTFKQAGMYCSLTQDKSNQSRVWVVGLSIGNAAAYFKGDTRLNCRPVRLVEIKP